jgi:signal transduction histidine kinase
LRTPLTSIAGFAEMLEQGFGGALDEAGKGYAGAIVEASGKLGTLIDRVLDLTQAEGVLPIEKKHVELAILLHDAARDHKPAADAKPLEFVVQIDPNVGALSGDTRRLRQAIDQLLDNAILFTPPSGRVLLHATGDATAAQIVVSDNGPGMDAGQQATALNPFSRLDDSRDGGEALGIGLPLARQFVEAHGGTLTLYSEPGEGTAVSITLPR